MTDTAIRLTEALAKIESILEYPELYQSEYDILFQMMLNLRGMLSRRKVTL